MTAASSQLLARQNFAGAALMVGSMLGFAIEDAIIKRLSGGLSTGQILIFIGLGGMLIFMALLRFQGKAVLNRAMLSPAVGLRNLGEMIGTLGFVTSIVLTPLSSASAILQATPLVVTLGAALFLGETVGWRRWMAILIGLCGVLMIVRPGLEGFEPASLFAVIGVLGLSTRDVATRRVDPGIDSMQLSVLAFASIVPVGILVLPYTGGWQPISATEWGILGLVNCVSVLAYYAITAAMRLGEVSFVTPFRYARLIFALIIGTLFFGERPDLMTLAGAAVVILAGLYTFLREQQLKSMR